MDVAAKIGTSLALSALSPLLDKLSSKIGGDVTAAEMKHLNDFVRYEIVALTREAKSDDLLQSTPLLEDLQTAALELEDLLDLYEYNQIKKQVSSSSSNPIKKFITKSKEKLEPVLPKSPLRIGVEKLLKFVEQVEKLHPFIMSRKGTIQPPANTITPKTSTPSSPFYGRGDQCDMIIKLLLDKSHADLNSKTKTVPIIAIRGLGGAGKTTTAQHIYNENEIVSNFDLRMWVHVTRGFDERRLITEIIESAEKNACPHISNLDVLQAKLKDSVSTNKFLLVLDDVWEGDTGRLDMLLSPLNQVGVKGSRIIITTRTEKTAKDLNAKPIILLDELKDEDCWSILKHYAFDDNEEVLEDHQELKYVGNQIISKGFIENTSELTLEETGKKYFEELVSYSFFEEKLEGCGAIPNIEKLSSLHELRICCLTIESLSNLPVSLRSLRILECPAIESLPNLPVSLRSLWIRECPAIESLPNLPVSLRSLWIRECPAIESLPNLPVSLEDLDIRDCPAIESLPNLPVFLRFLRIWECPAIESLSNLPVSLRSLWIWECPAIELLPNLPVSLEVLDISKCPAIQSLPNLPVSLRRLDVTGCPKLKEKYEEGGPLRNTISHIPDISIQ